MEDFKEKLYWCVMHIIIVTAFLLLAIGYGLWLLFKGGQRCLRKVTG